LRHLEEKSLNMRKIARLHILLAIAAVCAAVGAITAISLIDRADAQTAPAQGAQANVTYGCFDSKRLVIRSWDTPYTTTSGMTYLDIPAAGLNMVAPVGSGCIIATFEADMNASSNDTLCLLGAQMNGVTLNPGFKRVVVGTQPRFVSITWTLPYTVTSQTTFLVKVIIHSSQLGQTCTVNGWHYQVERRQ
jgi:hypothetical protein